MKKPDYFGVGPRIFKVVFPYLAITIAMTIIFPQIFTFGEAARSILLIAGIILMLLGVVFYGMTVRLLVPGLKEGRLVTSGPFRLCQNPLYAALILMVFPGLGLVLNSWLMVTIIIPGYLAFKSCIRGEYKVMEDQFGDEYRQYRQRIPEFFPFGRPGEEPKS